MSRFLRIGAGLILSGAATLLLLELGSFVLVETGVVHPMAHDLLLEQLGPLYAGLRFRGRDG